MFFPQELDTLEWHWVSTWGVSTKNRCIYIVTFLSMSFNCFKLTHIVPFAWAHNKVNWLIRLHIMLCSVMWLFASYVCDPTTRQDKTVVRVINQLINRLLCIKCTQPKASQSVFICFGRKYRNKVFLCFIWNCISIYTFSFKKWAGRDEGGATIFVCDNR